MNPSLKIELNASSLKLSTVDPLSVTLLVSTRGLKAAVISVLDAIPEILSSSACAAARSVSIASIAATVSLTPANVI